MGEVRGEKARRSKEELAFIKQMYQESLTLKRAGDLESVSLLCLLAACMRRLMASSDCLLDLTSASIHL